jgi:hypothetical protein
MGALGRSLDLLINDDWHGACIDDLVRLELAAQALAGKVTHQFAPDGARWTLDIPAAVLRQLSERTHERASASLIPDEMRGVSMQRVRSGCESN